MMKFIILALSDNHIESNRGVKRRVPHFPDGDPSSVGVPRGSVGPAGVLGPRVLWPAWVLAVVEHQHVGEVAMRNGSHANPVNPSLNLPLFLFKKVNSATSLGS